MRGICVVTMDAHFMMAMIRFVLDQSCEEASSDSFNGIAMNVLSFIVDGFISPNFPIVVFARKTPFPI